MAKIDEPMNLHFFRFSILLLCLFQFVFPQNLQAQVTEKYYVSTNGNDSHPGTIRKPFKTIQKALSQGGNHTEIILKQGIYYLGEPLILSPENIKMESLKIQAEEGEKVIISGGKELSLQWKPWVNGIFTAKITKGLSFEQLYVNGDLQQMARYPNLNKNEILGGTAADAVAPERVKSWSNPVGGYVHGLISTQWGSIHHQITGKDADGKLNWEGGYQINRQYPLHQEYRYVENIFEELDSPGEWFLDKAQNQLYYYPHSGLDLKKAKIIVSQVNESLILKGTTDKKLKNITISGIGFQHNERTFMETKEPMLRSDWRMYRGGAVVLENTENIKIENCTFTNLGGNAIVVNGYNKDNRISGNHIHDIGSSGILILGKMDAVRSPIFSYSGFIAYKDLDLTPGPQSDNYPGNIRIDNNLIHDIGQIEKQVAGVNIDVASCILIDHNTIYNLPRAGINIGEGNFGGHILEYNDVFNTVLETGDHGAFNSWGRDRFWTSDVAYMDSLNLIHPDMFLLDAQETTTIRYNRFRCDRGWDIDLDDGSSNYEIYNNVALQGGIKLREGFKRTVRNNIVINNSIHEHVWFQNSRDTVEGNLLMTAHAPIRLPKAIQASINFNYYTDADAMGNAQSMGWDSDGKLISIQFSNPEKGDYYITSGLPATSEPHYFKNFSIGNFGTQVAQLKAIAATPPFPELRMPKEGETESTVDFLGAQLKNIQDINEQSAYGLANTNGVILIKLSEESPFYKSGLKRGDVIIEMDGIGTHSVKELLNAYLLIQFKNETTVKIIRNQEPKEIKLKLK